MNGKVLNILIAIIAIIGIVLFVMVGMAEEASESLSSATSTIVDYSLTLLIAAVVISVVLSILSLLRNPEALKKTLLGLVVLGVLFAISYFSSSDAAVIGTSNELLAPQGDTSKWSGTGLIFSYILLVVGGVFFVWDLLKGLIKA